MYLKDNKKYLNLTEKKAKILNSKNINTDDLNQININLENTKQFSPKILVNIIKK